MGETGTASVNTMGSGHLSRPALRTAGNIAFNAGPGLTPRLVAAWSVPFGARPLPAAERGLGRGKKSAVPTADSPPETSSPQFQISNSHTINKIVSP